MMILGKFALLNYDEPFGVAQWFEFGFSMREVSSSKLLARESKGFAFWVELVAPGLSSAVTSPMWLPLLCGLRVIA